IDSWRGMALEVNDIAFVIFRLGAEEVIESDFKQRGRRGIRGYVSADTGLFAIRTHHHGQRVPTDEASDAPLNIAAAGIDRLPFGRDRIQVRRVGRERNLNTGLLSVTLESRKE